MRDGRRKKKKKSIPRRERRETEAWLEKETVLVAEQSSHEMFNIKM